jgi:hypothetical protein
MMVSRQRRHPSRPPPDRFSRSIGRLPGWSSPTLRLHAGCCACAASGHAAAVPPTSVMNSRRRILVPKTRALHPLKQVLWIGTETIGAVHSQCLRWVILVVSVMSAGGPLRPRSLPTRPDQTSSALGHGTKSLAIVCCGIEASPRDQWDWNVALWTSGSVSTLAHDAKT